MPDYAAVNDYHALKFTRLSGALTNTIFAVTVLPPPEGQPQYDPKPRKCLLRIYGKGVEDLFSREIELFWFRVLSELRVGPRLWTWFRNGRLEELLESETLTAAKIRDKDHSNWIAEKLAEIHTLGRLLENKVPLEIRGDMVFIRLRGWSTKAASLLPELKARYTNNADLVEIEKYITALDSGDELYWLITLLASRGGSPSVFCHNDLQYGNILHLTKPDKSRTTSYSSSSLTTNPIVMIDYEYAGFNPRGFDIGNHFCEWMADYHCDTPHKLMNAFPTEEQQGVFLKSYLDNWLRLAGKIWTPTRRARELQVLHREANDYATVSHLFWGVWGVIQARNSEIEFDYLGYSAERFKAYESLKRSRFWGAHQPDDSL